MFFSRNPLGFYFENPPKNSVEISMETYQELLLGQSSGKIIKSDINGYPYLEDNIPTQEEMITSERYWRDSELIRSDIELNKVQDSDKKAVGSVSQWREYRKALRALPEHPLFPSREARPQSPDLK